MAHIRLASVAWPDGVRSVGERDPSTRAKIDNYFNFSVETMYVARLMVHRVGRKPDAAEADRTHWTPL
jgi:hypothetical protein